MAVAVAAAGSWLDTMGLLDSTAFDGSSRVSCDSRSGADGDTARWRSSMEEVGTGRGGVLG